MTVIVESRGRVETISNEEADRRYGKEMHLTTIRAALEQSGLAEADEDNIIGSAHAALDAIEATISSLTAEMDALRERAEAAEATCNEDLQVKKWLEQRVKELAASILMVPTSMSKCRR